MQIVVIIDGGLMEMLVKTVEFLMFPSDDSKVRGEICNYMHSE